MQNPLIQDWGEKLLPKPGDFFSPPAAECHASSLFAPQTRTEVECRNEGHVAAANICALV